MISRLSEKEAEIRAQSFGKILAKILPCRPNTITALRFILSILFLFPVSKEMALAAAALIVILDGLDGALAKATNQQTFVGKLADPLADRFFGICFVCYLVINEILPVKLAGLIAALELGRWLYVYFIARWRGDKIEPNLLAKLQLNGYGLGFTLLLIGQWQWGEFIIYLSVIVGLGALGLYVFRQATIKSAAEARALRLRSTLYQQLLSKVAPVLVGTLGAIIIAQLVSLTVLRADGASHLIWLLFFLVWTMALPLLWLETVQRVGQCLKLSLREIDPEAFSRYDRNNTWTNRKKIWAALEAELS